MDNLLITLIIALILCLGVLITVLVYFGHRFIKLRELEAKSLELKTKAGYFVGDDNNSSSSITSSTSSSLKLNPELLNSLRASKKETQAAPLYCVDHPDELNKGRCAISGDLYCEHCLTKQGDVIMAKKYLNLYLDNDWVEVIMIANNKKNMDVKERIMKMKRSFWQDKDLPLIVQGHYKINIQDDEIEEYTVLFARKEDEDFVKKELSFIKE